MNRTLRGSEPILIGSGGLSGSLMVSDRRDLLRNVLTLVTGTAFSQAIPIAFMPILTRVYSPEDFGVFALYVSITSLLSVAATGRYELAVMLPERDEDAVNIVVLGIVVSAGLSLLMALAVWIQGDTIAAFLGSPAIRDLLFVVPATVFVAGLHQSLNAWRVRHKRFRSLASLAVAESGTTAVSQTVLSQVVVSGGQVFGSFLGKAVAATANLGRLLRTDSAMLEAVSRLRVIANARQYIRFPLYSVPARMLGATGTQLPVFLLTRFFGSATAGYFSLTFRVLSLPITFVSSALQQVLFQRIVQIHRVSPHRVKSFVVGVFAVLLLAISPLVLIMWWFGEPLFVLVFGEQWRPAGELAFLIAFGVSARFAVAPLGVVLNLEKNIRLGSAWQALYFVTMLSVLFAFRESDLRTFVTAYAVHEVTLYTIYLLFILHGSRHVEDDKPPSGG